MKLTRWISACLLLAGLIVWGHDALAQFGGRGGMGGMGGMNGMGGRSRPPDAMKGEQRNAPENLADQIEYRLNLLQEDLKLRPDQYNVWATYTDKVKVLTADIARERNRAYANNNAMQQINGIADGIRNRLTAVEDIALSAKVLYETLSPEQKPVADARLASTLPDVYTGRPGIAMTR